MKIICGTDDFFARKGAFLYENGQEMILSASSDRLGELTGKNATVKISAKTLKKMISKTSFAIGQDYGDYGLSGVLLEADAQSITLVTANNYRVAVCKEVTDTDTIERQIVILSGEVVKRIEKLIDETNEEIEITFDDALTVFKGSDFVFKIKNINKAFVQYKSLIEKEYNTEIIADAKELKDALTHISPVIENYVLNPVKLTIKDDKITLSCHSVYGCAEAEIEAENINNSIEIGFNFNYLYGVVSHCDSEKLLLRISSPLEPIVISALREEGAVFVVCPVKLEM